MTLYDLDNLYKTTVSKLSKEERLWYCTRHLRKLQRLLRDDSEDTMNPSQKTKMEELVNAILEEITRIRKTET